ncbi:hypothetical protein LJR175_007377 [Variovorax sp. LjRoot175]|uniref:hypothetical protein n=1 Tax=Variovorax sp. LjRoot175 TaxID=3342276 RepID=UPI003ECFC0F8
MEQTNAPRKWLEMTKPLSDKLDALREMASPSKALDMLKALEPSSRTLESISRMNSMFAKQRRELTEFSREPHDVDECALGLLVASRVSSDVTPSRFWGCRHNRSLSHARV